jgi:predicted aspartyl protease
MPNHEFTFSYNKYPIVPVKFYYKNKETPIIDALLDSGGDFIVIPMPIAKYLDLKLKKAGDVDTAGGTTTLFKAKLNMVVGTKENNTLYDNLEIHVSARNDIPILLGRFPIFEDFEITFKKQENKLIIKTPSP